MQRSLTENDLTVVSIFVNPTQFAPHEDLTTYPRTLPRDIGLLEAQNATVLSSTRKVSAVFFPSVQEMYPSGISQDVASQTGTFVEVKGYGEEMEGKSRPTFFRGVATVVTKLFNAVEVLTRFVAVHKFLTFSYSLRTRILDRKTSSKLFSCGACVKICFCPIRIQIIYTSYPQGEIQSIILLSLPEMHI